LIPQQNPWATTGTDSTGLRMFPQFPLQEPSHPQKAPGQDIAEESAASGLFHGKRKRTSGLTMDEGKDQSQSEKRVLIHARAQVSQKSVMCVRF
jgi:hypothetical protein